MHGSHVLSARRTTDGAVTTQRSKVHGVYYLASGTAGVIELKNSSTGDTLLAIDTPALATWTCFVPVAGNGVLFKDGIYVETGAATAVTVIYTT